MLLLPSRYLTLVHAETRSPNEKDMKLFLKTYRSRQFFHIHIVFFSQLHYLLYNSVSQIKMPVSVQLSVAHFKEARGGVGVGVCVCSSRCECMAGGWWWDMLGMCWMCYYRAGLGWGCVGCVTLDIVPGCSGSWTRNHGTHRTSHHHQGSNYSAWLEVLMEF